mmetsp:Transcript_55674/g.154228  ORF Transcript_55674/g.154228 Transcript_55674/m.154228 type:complete len:100 (-) Transcript_55674:71-370(-)
MDQYASRPASDKDSRKPWRLPAAARCPEAPEAAPRSTLGPVSPVGLGALSDGAEELDSTKVTPALRARSLPMCGDAKRELRLHTAPEEETETSISPQTT